MNPKLAGYRPGQLSPLYRRIHDSIADIPGVSSVALCLFWMRYGLPRQMCALSNTVGTPVRPVTMPDRPAAHSS